MSPKIVNIRVNIKYNIFLSSQINCKRNGYLIQIPFRQLGIDRHFFNLLNAGNKILQLFLS